MTARRLAAVQLLGVAAMLAYGAAVLWQLYERSAPYIGSLETFTPGSARGVAGPVTAAPAVFAAVHLWSRAIGRSPWLTRPAVYGFAGLATLMAMPPLHELVPQLLIAAPVVAWLALFEVCSTTAPRPAPTPPPPPTEGPHPR